MLNSGFAPWPSFSDEEIEAVSMVLRSNRVNYWTGDEGRKFEAEFAAWTGAAHAVALTNGTVALDLALNALGMGPGDEIIVTPRTFLASVSSVINAGATPVFADVDPDSGNITAESIASVLTPRTRAVIPVHLAGWPCDMGPILDLCGERGIRVIEDCAQAHGALYRGKPVGTIGDVGAWSFCQDKIMSTGGEGGMVTTNDHGLWSHMWSYKDHGKSWDAVYNREHPPGFRWVHESFGTNWRMMEVQAVLGCVQLKRMQEWTEARTRNAGRLIDALRPFSGATGPVRVPTLDQHESRHAYYKFYAYVRPDRLAAGWNRDRIIAEIATRGVPCFQGSCSEVYLERAFDDTGLRPLQRLPVARDLGETSLMFLVHPTLTEDDLIRSEQALSEVLTLASR